MIPRFCGEDCKPRCSVEGCGGAVRKRAWCASHYAQWRATGNAPEPFKWRWAESGPCKVCGDLPGYGYREFCGATCWALWKFHGGEVPAFRECIACGAKIDLTIRGRGGQRVKAVIKFCRRCRQDYGKYKLTVAQLAERDGTDCGICHRPVDMSLRRFDNGGNMCPSVDHILPRARGGTHEPENLALVHLLCNIRKSDRIT